ncbi:hypothetical protein TYRP_020002 [Tyrophagus putrescentiae]|nr:hypothetical protein TYRP_020002 [Tyrophagus putrescentiae]
MFYGTQRRTLDHPLTTSSLKTFSRIPSPQSMPKAFESASSPTIFEVIFRSNSVQSISTSSIG